MNRQRFAWLFGRSPEERSIGYAAAGVLGVAVTTSMLVMASVLMQHVHRTYWELMTRLLDSHREHFLLTLDEATGRVENVVRNRPHFRKLLLKRSQGRAVPGDLPELEGILANIAQDRQVMAITLYDAEGRLLASRGRFVTDVPISVPIAGSPESRLSWQDGFVLQTTAPIVEQGVPLGTVRMDVRLRSPGKMLAYADLGKTGEIVVCAPAGPGMQCFPSRHSARGYAGPREVNGKPLPMHHALEGRHGVTETLDYRGHEVRNVYAPLRETGLGMVVKIDTAELRQPFLAALPWFAALLTALLASGLFMMRWRLAPLIQDMVNAHDQVKAVIENAPEAIVTIDARGCIQGFNPAACAMFGYAPDEVAGRNVGLLMPEPYRSQHDGHLQRYLRTDEPHIIGRGSRQVEGLRKDGTCFAVELLVAAIPAKGERGFIGLMRDVTDRKRMEDDLLESRERFRALVETTSDWIWEVDENGVYTYVSPSCRHLLGYEPGELIGKRPFDLMPEAEAERVRNLLLEFKTRAFHGLENVNLRSDGRLVVFDTSAVPIFNSEGEFRGYRGIDRDVTERKRQAQELQQNHDAIKTAYHQLGETQAQLLQSEKMASIGQLAAGVAHEINNPIGYVFSNLGSLDDYVRDILNVIDAYEIAESSILDAASLARIKQAKDAVDLAFIKNDVQDLMRETREGIARVKKIVQDLKDFSRIDSSDEWQWADLQQGLEATLNIVHNELKYKAEIVREYGGLPEVECLPPQLNQVFLNLLVNAGHAIETRGTITLRTGTEDKNVWVEIEDTGIGIAPENMKHVFTPFFTTKPVGTGTGLGLSLSYGIVKKHHGTIEVRSELGKGTRFRVWLPISQREKQEIEDQGHA